MRFLTEKDENRAYNAVNFAYQMKYKAESIHLTPKGYVIGFSLYYDIKYFCQMECPAPYQEEGSKITLFGLPIKLVENNRYELSLEIEEFNFDFEKVVL